MDKHRIFVNFLWIAVPILTLLNGLYGHYLTPAYQTFLLYFIWGFVIFIFYIYAPRIFKIQSKFYIILLILMSILIGLVFYILWFVPPGASLISY